MDKKCNLPLRTKSGFVVRTCVRFCSSKTQKMAYLQNQNKRTNQIWDHLTWYRRSAPPPYFKMRKKRYTFQDSACINWLFSSNKKNDRLYQKTTYNHIHQLNRLWKNSPCLGLIEKEYNKHFSCIIILCPTHRWNRTYSKNWIKMMITFDL